jgi:hypothetical protein
LALFSVLPLTNLPSNALGAALDATIGTTLFITALGDHLLLVRTLHGPRQAMA